MRYAFMCVNIFLVGIIAAQDQIDPMAGLPPEPRSLQLNAATTVQERVGAAVDSKGLEDDIVSLKKAVERVRKALVAGEPGSSTEAHGGAEAEHNNASAHSSTEPAAAHGAPAHGSTEHQEPAKGTGHSAEHAAASNHGASAANNGEHETAGAGHNNAHVVDQGAAPHRAVGTTSGVRAEAEGPRKPSARLKEKLTMQRLVDGGALISASIERETLETVYQEIAKLLGMQLDDTQVASGRRAVSINLNDVSWEEALDRLLGQAGVAWRAEGSGQVKTLVLFDRDRASGGDVLERLAERALVQASQSKDPVASAEALWLIGQQQFTAKRYLESMRLWSNLADRYGNEKNPIIRRWVMRAVKGIGDAMMEMKQYGEARGIFLNYIARITESEDPDAPEVYLSCAEAGRRDGALRQDPLAYDQAVDILHDMLEKFAERPEATAEVHLARLALGELLIEAGRWREAETQLSLFSKNGKGDGLPADQLAFWLAECAYNLGRTEEARIAYEELYRSWRTLKGETKLPQTLYQTSAMRIGQCYMRTKEPQWVNAIFAFLRARQDFSHTVMGAEIAISIARCYAELNRDDDSVAILLDTLKRDEHDTRPGRMQIDQLLSELEGGLAAYPGPIRGRVLFYIAQAEYRQAVRDRSARAMLADSAINHYDRVMAERPGPELLGATRLGLSRAALLAGQEQRAEVMLISLLRETNLDARDRAMAAQLLGAHYREKGMLREAIKAYAGEAE